MREPGLSGHLHTGLLAGCLVEAAHRPFIPALGWTVLAVVLIAAELWQLHRFGLIPALPD